MPNALCFRLFYITIAYVMRVEITHIPPQFDRYFRTEEDTLEACLDGPFEHYPPQNERWHIAAEDWDEMAKTGVITIPDGSWVVSNHPARARAAAEGKPLDPENPDNIDPAQKAAWRQEYRLVTDRGLPVHPMARLGVTSEVWDKKEQVMRRLGMATGIGRERRYGASKTGALLLARLGLDGEVEYPVVTEVRNNIERLTFPGGYAEPNEFIADTCIREGNEEVTITEACERAGIPWKVIESMPHALWRLTPSVTGPNTVNAWRDEHFLVIDATSIPDMQGVNLRVGEPDNIESVEWRRARELRDDPMLLGTHKRALRAHLSIIAPA